MKKFSKKLFCLMLVAIMVATAIPFGAFADPAVHTGHDGEPAVWVYDPSRSSEITEGKNVSDNAQKGTHPVVCKSCTTEKARDAVYHNYNAEGVCEGCNYDSRYYVHVTGALGDHTQQTNVDIKSADLAAALNLVGIDADKMKIHDSSNHSGEGYYASMSYDPASHTVNISISEDKHNLAVLKDGITATTHMVKCQVTGCAFDEAVAHSYDSTTGLCACGAKDASKEFKYTVSIWTTGNIQLAENKEALMTEAAAEAVKTNAKQAIADNFPSVYKDLTISSLDTAAATVDHDKREIRLTVNKQEPAQNHDNEIQVVYDDGTITYIPRKVGSWYFSTSNLGLDDTWGTTQAKLKIYDANGSRTVQWDSEDNDAFVKATDYKVEVKGINRTVTIYFMKTSTANPTTTDAYATKYYEANTRLGVLPSLPDGYTGWYVGQEELTVDTVYHWKEKSVYAYPGKGVGSGRVHLFIYNKDNELMKNVDVTENVQDNGLITKTGLMNTIEYQTGRKNPTVAGLFDESGWAYYLNNKNSTAKAKSSVDVGRAADRQGTQNIYVVLTNVSGGSNADTSNPKTGDTAMIGTAAVVMALAAVGMGTAFYMKKKELF